MILNVKQTKKQDPILYLNSEPFHSRVSPYREAQSIIKKNFQSQEIKESLFAAIIYGAELGYLIEELEQNPNCKSIILILGPEQNKFSNYWKKKLSNHNQVFKSVIEAIRFINQQIENYSLIELKIEKLLRIFHPSYTNIALTEVQSFNEMFYSLYSKFLSTKETYENKYNQWLENASFNLAAEKSSLSSQIKSASFIPKTKKRVLLLGAGVSLDRKIRKLKKFRDEYLILASDSLFPKLKTDGILADYFFSCETEEKNLKFFDENSIKNTVLIIDCIANKRFLSLGFKNIFLFAGKGSPVVKKVLDQKNESLNIPELPYSGSVGNAMLAAAINFIEADTIETLGIDSGFLGGRAYALHTYNEYLHLKESPEGIKVYEGPCQKDRKVFAGEAKIYGDTFHQTPEFINYGNWIENAKKTLKKYKSKKISLKNFRY